MQVLNKTVFKDKKNGTALNDTTPSEDSWTRARINRSTGRQLDRQKTSDKRQPALFHANETETTSTKTTLPLILDLPWS